MASAARQLTSASAFRILNIFATTTVSLLMMPFVVHTLGDRMYGLWGLVATLLGYYGLLDCGLTPAVCQHVAAALGRGDRAACNNVVSASLRFLLLVGVLVLLLSGVAAACAPRFARSAADAALFAQILLILGMSTALSFPSRVFTGFLIANLRYDLMVGAELVALALRTSLILSVLLLGHGLVAMAWATFAGGVTAMLLQAGATLRKYPWLRLRLSAPGAGLTRSLASYSIFSFAGQLSDRLRFQADPVVISMFVGLAAVTHYRIASTLTQQFIVLTVAVTGVFAPLFSRLYGASDPEKLRATFFFATKVSICITTFLGFGLIAWGRPFILRWMGPGYLDAYAPLVILTVAITFDLWQAPSVDLLYAIAKHRAYACLNFIEGILNLGLSLWLVRRYGMVGVALGTLGAMTVMRLAVQPLWTCRLSALSYRAYMRTAGAALGGTLVAASMVWLACGWVIGPGYWRLAGSAGAALCMYALVAMFLVFSSTERQRVWTALVPAWRILHPQSLPAMPSAARQAH
jgi:O-antigen/teichoic acid export membrane protein